MKRAFDRSAPGVRVTVLSNENATQGEPLDLKGRIISFAFEDCERKTDKVSLQLDNFDLSLFEHKDLFGGAVLKVSWGYPGNMAPPRRVVIKKLKGFQTLTLEGHAKSILMHRECKTRRWENVSKSDVVKQIAAEHGFENDLNIQSTKEKYEVINQIAETDARFLRRLAAGEEFEFFVDHTGFHWHERRQDTSPIRVFTFYTDPDRGDVLSINMESNLAKRTGRITVKSRDPLAKTTIESSSTSDDVERSTLGDVIEVVDPVSGNTTIEKRNATATVHASSAATSAEINKESAARFKRAERSSIKLSMRVVGDPTLTAKSIIELRNVSSLLSGKYYVTEVKHTISQAGYVCDLKLSRDGTSRVLNRQQQKQGGQKNQQEKTKENELHQIEVVNPVTGRTHLEFRSD